MKKTRLLIIFGIILLVLSFFYFVIHIVMLTHTIGISAQELVEFSEQPGFINYLAGHLNLYGFLFVVPSFFSLPGGLFV